MERKSKENRMTIQHPAHPYVVYGNTDPAPEPTTDIEQIYRTTKLATSAMRQAMTLIKYEEKLGLNNACDVIIPIPVFRTSPPIICSNGEYYRYTNHEWENAVSKAREELEKK